ncbi:MAG: VWA domain-containing protein [Firmicutes bacterium]|nr:VWA domain-containing protein [Bacillota bacterium]
MRKIFSVKKLKSLKILFLTVLTVSILSTSFAALAEKTLEPIVIDLPVMVSLGDSYSSGEGIPPFFGQDAQVSQKVRNDDWLAHRSQKSWPGRMTLQGINGTMMEKLVYKTWYFVASSGAETRHLKEEQEIEYDRMGYSGTKNLPAQLDIFDEIGTGTADYVTLTLGGNDAGFENILISAAADFNYIKFGNLEDKLNETWNYFYESGGIRDNLRQAYLDIQQKAGTQAKIIVAGYPKLLAEGGSGKIFSADEAKLINESVTNFNKEISNIVTSCKASGMKICFVPVEEAFENHEAYTDEPYINEVMFGARSEDLKDILLASKYSIHPNDSGAAVYAECVQNKIDEIEEDGGESEWPTRTTSDERDIVLVLDTSGSMSGTPIEETKKAASNFISTILQEDASIGIVTYDSSASMLSDFSVDEEYLEGIVDNITDGGGTNIEDGLKKAEEMLSESNAEKKIIVLMSDGQPNNGKVGDALISYADSIKDDGIYIYTLGFFENMGSDKSSAQTLMEQIASDGCHYEVADADDLVFFFGDIADQINGQKYIYIRIACPVDVSVTYDGETLSSEDDDSNIRTSFGSLTFEENKDSTAEDSTDDRIKVLRLKDGTDYDIEIAGNGIGEMNYTIGFMDENGDYSDLREFNNIEISKQTQIETVAANSSATVLKVDSDGDGKYDLKYKAKANGMGEIVNYTYIYYIVLAVVILIALLIMYIKIKQWKRQSAERKRQKQAAEKKFCLYCGNEMPGDKKFCSKCGKKL